MRAISLWRHVPAFQVPMPSNTKQPWTAPIVNHLHCAVLFITYRDLQGYHIRAGVLLQSVRKTEAWKQTLFGVTALPPNDRAKADYL